MKIKILIPLCLLALLLCACGGDTPAAEPTPAPQAVSTPTPEPTPEPTPTPVQYVTETVWLCTREKMTQYDTENVFIRGYEYDEYGRSTEFWQENGDQKAILESYEYDEAGNRILMYTSVSRHEYSYDERGNMLSDLYYWEDELYLETHYTYNDRDLPIRQEETNYRDGGIAVLYEMEYSEDFSSCRINRTENGVFTGYTLDSYNENGDLLRYDNYTADDVWKSGAAYEYREDGLLSLRWQYSSSETQADYDVIYTYDENGLLLSINVDYYYGHLMEYTYEPFEILVRKD